MTQPTKCMLFDALPVDVIGEYILPHLSFRELQSLDTASANKRNKEQFRRACKTYVYADTEREELVLDDLKWLCGAGVKIIGILMTLSDHFESITALTFISKHLSSLKQCTFHKLETYTHHDEPLRLLAQGCPLLEQLHFPDETYGYYTDIGIKALAEHCFALTSISLHSQCITNVAIEALCDNCPHLQHIDISHCHNLTDASLRAITIAYPNLQSLHMLGCNISDYGILFFACRCCKLQAITVSSFDPFPSIVLPYLWQQNPMLSHINISSNHCFYDNDVFWMLQCCRQLRNLSLPDCSGITDAAVIAVAQCCPHMSVINLSHCYNISNAALIAIAYHCHELESIDISYIHGITDVGVVALARGCSILQEFSAVNNSLKSAGVIALARGCRNLRKINVQFCVAVNSKAIIAIAEHCARVTELDLYECKVNNACLYSIAQHCRNLTALNIVSGTRWISRSAVLAIVKSCPQLRKLNFSDRVRAKGFLRQLKIVNPRLDVFANRIRINN